MDTMGSLSLEVLKRGRKGLQKSSRLILSFHGSEEKPGIVNRP